MFKGEAGALLKKEIVKSSQRPVDAEEEMEQIKKRPTEDQRKIKACILKGKWQFYYYIFVF
jgi:hypothetical protein